MTEKALQAGRPAELATMVECGYAIWATDTVAETLRARFDSERIPVVGVRHLVPLRYIGRGAHHL
jgi:hypothetical protein